MPHRPGRPNRSSRSKTSWVFICIGVAEASSRACHDRPSRISRRSWRSWLAPSCPAEATPAGVVRLVDKHQVPRSGGENFLRRPASGLDATRRAQRGTPTTGSRTGPRRSCASSCHEPAPGGTTGRQGRTSPTAPPATAVAPTPERAAESVQARVGGGAHGSRDRLRWSCRGRPRRPADTTGARSSGCGRRSSTGAARVRSAASRTRPPSRREPLERLGAHPTPGELRRAHRLARPRPGPEAVAPSRPIPEPRSSSFFSTASGKSRTVPAGRVPPVVPSAVRRSPPKAARTGPDIRLPRPEHRESLMVVAPTLADSLTEPSNTTRSPVTSVRIPNLVWNSRSASAGASGTPSGRAARRS